jgi:hypothetical protein
VPGEKPQYLVLIADGSDGVGKTAVIPEYDASKGRRPDPRALTVILDGVKDDDDAADSEKVKLFLWRYQAAGIGLERNDRG